MRYSQRLISVKGLKEFLENVPDDTFVVVHGFGQLYLSPLLILSNALMHEGDLLDEPDFEQARGIGLKKGEKLVKILIVE